MPEANSHKDCVKSLDKREDCRRVQSLHTRRDCSPCTRTVTMFNEGGSSRTRHHRQSHRKTRRLHERTTLWTANRTASPGAAQRHDFVEVGLLLGEEAGGLDLLVGVDLDALLPLLRDA